MLSRLPFAAILACTFAFLFSATAGAALVAISPGGNVTGTAGSTQWTFNTARRTVNCTMSDFTARLATGNGGSFPLGISTNLQPAFSTCTLTGGLRPAIACGATGGWAVTGRTIGSTTPGTAHVSCQISITGTCSVNIAGSFAFNYSNATGWAELVSPSGQSLVASGSTCTALPNDFSVTFGIVGGGSIFYIVSPYQSMTAS
jgi:hypothetical protein